MYNGWLNKKDKNRKKDRNEMLENTKDTFQTELSLSLSTNSGGGGAFHSYASNKQTIISWPLHS